MAYSSESLLMERQLKLNKQRQLIEQKRRERHQQVHTGMITASGIGQRPISGSRSRRLSGDMGSFIDSSKSTPSAIVPLSNATNIGSSGATRSLFGSSIPLSSSTSVPLSSSTSVPLSSSTSVPLSSSTNIPLSSSTSVPLSSSTSVSLTDTTTHQSTTVTSLNSIIIASTSITNTPPSNVTNTPPSNVTNTPPSNVTNTPPSNVTNTPPSNVTNTPPSNVTNIPPSNVTNIPSFNSTSGLLSNSTDELTVEIVNEATLDSDMIEDIDTIQQQPLPNEEENPIDLSQKLSTLGLTSEVGRHDTEDDYDNNDHNELESSFSMSPIHVAAVVPTSHERDTEVSASINDNPLEVVLDEDGLAMNLNEIIFKPPAENETIKCRITRDKQGLDKQLSPIYYLHYEKDSIRKVFLLAGRKRKIARSAYYTISTDPTDMSRDGDKFVAKLRSNFVGTSFTLYDSGQKPPSSNMASLREELALVSYEMNVLGFKGPRKMTVLIPVLDKNSERIKVKPMTESDTLYERFKIDDMSNLVKLYNKSPKWSKDEQAYVLNFHGRVTQPSIKNFQLVHSTDEDYVVLQFGRIYEDTFTMDYKFPMCAVQAFAIALSSFDNKWACE